MNYRILFIALAVGLFTLSSCQNEQNRGDQESHAESSEEHMESNEHDHEGHSATVQLNDGKRWEANPETTEGIERMKELMESFQPMDSARSYHKLNAKLMNEYQYIFKECTMKGESHQQLHNYLLPLKVQFEKLQSEELDTCQTAFRTIEKHLDKYSEYFK